MIEYLKNIWDKLKFYFTTKKEDLSTRNKGFRIRETSNTKSNKLKFEITDERSVPTRNGKINIINKSRPQRCGQCGTEKSYTKSGNFWECKVCKYKIKA